jgi:hypothetical protein
LISIARSSDYFPSGKGGAENSFVNLRDRPKRVEIRMIFQDICHVWMVAGLEIMNKKH